MRVTVATTSGSILIELSLSVRFEAPAVTVRPASVPRTLAAEANIPSAMGRRVSGTLVLALDDLADPDRQLVAVHPGEHLELLPLVHRRGQRLIDRLVEQQQITGLERDQVAQRNHRLAQLDPDVDRRPLDVPRELRDVVLRHPAPGDDAGR